MGLRQDRIEQKARAKKLDFLADAIFASVPLILTERQADELVTSCVQKILDDSSLIQQGGDILRDIRAGLGK